MKVESNYKTGYERAMENRHRLKVYEMIQRYRWSELIKKPQKYNKDTFEKQGKNK